MNVDEIHHVPIWHQQRKDDHEVQNDLEDHRLHEMLHLDHAKRKDEQVQRIFIREDDLVQTTGDDEVHRRWIDAKIDGDLCQRLRERSHHSQRCEQEIA